MKLIPTFDAATSVAYLADRDNIKADAVISDLFFNYAHDDSVDRASITKDAEEFAGSFRVLLGHPIDVDALVADYFDRL